MNDNAPCLLGSRWSVMKSGALALLSAVGGCAIVGEDYETPPSEVESEYVGRSESGDSAVQVDLGRWWESLGDPVLDGLVEQALENSLDLRSAIANVSRSAELLGVAVGNRYPDIDAAGSFTRNRNGANSFPPVTDPTTFNLWNSTLEFAWEVDVWGRVTRVIEVADAEFEASIEDLRDVRALLVADLVSAYIDLREGESRARVAGQNIEIQQRSLTLTQTRFDAGAAPRLDVAQARTNLANTQAVLPQIRESVRLARLRLGVLLGQDPTRFVREFEAGGDLPEAPAAVDLGVPADLLRQRADIRSAERLFAAEFAQIGVEEGDLYPRFFLSGSIGYEATDSGDFLSRRSGIFGVGPGFTWNLFDGGRERGEWRAQEQSAEIAFLAYRSTVLLAIEEVEGAVFGLARERERAAALGRSVDAAADSAELSRQLYLEGRSNFQNVLDSERNLFDAQDSLIESRAAVVQRYVDLLRAMGGGWQTAEGSAEA